MTVRVPCQRVYGALAAPTPFHRVKPVSVVFQDQLSLMSLSFSVAQRRAVGQVEKVSTNAVISCAPAPLRFGHETCLFHIDVGFKVPKMYHLQSFVTIVYLHVSRDIHLVNTQPLISTFLNEHSGWVH